MPRIRLLPDALVSQIAAGEVVERPSSVAKELIENALDAGATALEIDLDAGGVRRIRVADDGCGMDRDDALLAFDRHATSKIASFGDLERVGSLGFRGEALAAIAAVSKVDLVSAPTPGEGTRVRLEGTRVLTVEPMARARGTTIEVVSLFWNVPARRKFLKSRATELRRAVEVVEGYALARPEVSFRLRHEGRVLLDAPAVLDDPRGLRARVAQLFGPVLERELIAISDEPGAEIGGLLGTPRTARGRRTFLYVNRRLVRDRTLMAAFYRAVREEWRSEDFPALMLDLRLDPERVDVNVHPQKTEVRFREHAFADRVGTALRAALARARGEEPAPLRAPTAGPAIAPAWEGLGGRHVESEIRESSVTRQDRSSQSGVRSPADGTGAAATPSGAGATGPGAFPFNGSFSSLPSTTLSPVSPGSARIALATLAPLDRAPVPLSGRRGEVRPFRLLGQYKGTLVLLEGPDGLYLLDQHVAHERILYERLRRELEAERPAMQRLLTPALLELARSEALRLAELAPALAEAGFEVEELSGGTLALTAAPAALGPEQALALALVLATDREATPENLRRRLLDDFAAATACKAAVKMHHPLSAEKLEALVSELFCAENPYACPHGRPVVLLLSDADLERRFGRR